MKEIHGFLLENPFGSCENQSLRGGWECNVCCASCKGKREGGKASWNRGEKIIRITIYLGK